MALPVVLIPTNSPTERIKDAILKINANANKQIVDFLIDGGNTNLLKLITKDGSIISIDLANTLLSEDVVGLQADYNALELRVIDLEDVSHVQNTDLGTTSYGFQLGYNTTNQDPDGDQTLIWNTFDGGQPGILRYHWDDLNPANARFEWSFNGVDFFDLLAGGAIPTLQAVTGVGNETTNDIIVTNNTDLSLIMGNDRIIMNNTFDGVKLTLFSNLDNPGTWNQEFQSASGVIALTSDIPANVSLIGGNAISTAETSPGQWEVSLGGNMTTSVDIIGSADAAISFLLEDAAFFKVNLVDNLNQNEHIFDIGNNDKIFLKTQSLSSIASSEVSINQGIFTVNNLNGNIQTGMSIQDQIGFGIVDNVTSAESNLLLGLTNFGYTITEPITNRLSEFSQNLNTFTKRIRDIGSGAQMNNIWNLPAGTLEWLNTDGTNNTYLKLNNTGIEAINNKLVILSNESFERFISLGDNDAGIQIQTQLADEIINVQAVGGSVYVNASTEIQLNQDGGNNAIKLDANGININSLTAGDIVSITSALGDIALLSKGPLEMTSTDYGTMKINSNGIIFTNAVNPDRITINNKVIDLTGGLTGYTLKHTGSNTYQPVNDHSWVTGGNTNLGDGNYNTRNYSLYVDTAVTPKTVTLPNAPYDCQEITVKDAGLVFGGSGAGTNNITIIPGNGTDKIENLAVNTGYTVSVDLKCTVLRYTSTLGIWFVI